jgi:diguanylate cyclase (GGDEF)-like protein
VSVQEKVAAEAIGQPVDALTGLPALHVAKDRAGMAMNLAYRNQKQVAFLFLDLDDFGHLVQREGEETGNGLLVGIAKRLTEMVRSSDTVTRVEKDRFLIILLDVQGAVDAGKVAEKIIKDLALPVPVDNKMLRTSASIGIALFPDNATEPDELIAQAKKAMEQVKKNGKNAHSFANEL